MAPGESQRHNGNRTNQAGGLLHVSSACASSLTRFLVSFQHEDNCMDIREYVIALSVVCRPAKTLETMKLAFKVFFSPLRLKFYLITGKSRRPFCFRMRLRDI